jgi:hypothetical protein
MVTRPASGRAAREIPRAQRPSRGPDLALSPAEEMSMDGGDIAVEILKEIRDEIHLLRTETAERFGVVETALLDLAATAERESRLGPRVSALEGRVDKLESK